VERIGTLGCLTVADVGIPTEYGRGAVLGIRQGSRVLGWQFLWGDRTVGGGRSPWVGSGGRRRPPSVICVRGRGLGTLWRGVRTVRSRGAGTGMVQRVGGLMASLELVESVELCSCKVEEILIDLRQMVGK